MQEEVFQNKKEFRLVGLSRSGNHGVINWIINQLEGRYCFLNCTEPKHNPFSTVRPLNADGDVYRTNIRDFNLDQEKTGKFSSKDFLLYNHEDCFLGPLNGKFFQQKKTEWTGESKERKDILLLRDPYNLFASRLKSGLIRGHYTHHGSKPISLLTLQRLYKQHAREFLGEKNYLKNKILINFNLWARSRDYREKLAIELGIPFTDKGFKEVTEVAGGSSFDGTKFSGMAHKMDVNDRWKKYAADPEFQDLFDPEINELATRIFGEIEPVKHFKNNLISV
ncbi:hypothetical protein LZ575_08175 [Antarcticibacterium sp. 1MA-6-2]|uniref:hypothetical protein n=1 Tax=Antarcticibacterium sp. 1MA-6-2 TaxID=2908210 RepID=UPI001F29E678|nr:hypothetical protein [Antarcticibacterium sp. 1MA-6-2]UJH92461.1 hypothetical protein LZ575_08175 [Antarcticibacterium sp. 1MA-6-2]